MTMGRFYISRGLFLFLQLLSSTFGTMLLLILEISRRLDCSVNLSLLVHLKVKVVFETENSSDPRLHSLGVTNLFDPIPISKSLYREE